MQDVRRLTTDEFFGWQALIEGRYELIDGHIIPHPDFVTPLGFAAPDADHALVCANLVAILQKQLRSPCRVYIGAGVVVDRVNANVPDLSVSSEEGDRTGSALVSPRLIFEVSSPKTSRIDAGRKVADYLGIASLEAYLFIDCPRRSITVYRKDAGPQTITSDAVSVSGIAFAIVDTFA